MKTCRIVGLLLALGASQAAVADNWDRLDGRYSRDGLRFGYVDDHPGRGYARGHDRQRSQVNIIVAPRAPVSRWAPRWNDHYDRYDRRQDRRRNEVVFNSSLGFIAGAVVGMTIAPQASGRNSYARDYREPRHDMRSSSISLYKDRFGTCYERETDYYGHVIQRRIADYNCNF